MSDQNIDKKEDEIQEAVLDEVSGGRPTGLTSGTPGADGGTPGIDTGNPGADSGKPGADSDDPSADRPFA